MDGIVLRALVRTMFKQMFEAPIQKDALDAFVAYSTYGGTCVLGKQFHTMTAGLVLWGVYEGLRKLRSYEGQRGLGLL